jgi:hypothetical protein
MQEVLKGVLKGAKISEKSLKQNIGIGKSYSGKHDIRCNMEKDGKSNLNNPPLDICLDQSFYLIPCFQIIDYHSFSLQ